jgi:hypothetical protein
MPGSTLLAISHNGAIAEDAVLMFSSALKDQESSMGREVRSLPLHSLLNHLGNSKRLLLLFFYITMYDCCD